MIAEAANRIMPPRSFYGAAYNSMISGLVMNHTRYVRPLASGERILGRFIVPTFQRGLVWTEAQQVRLIESIYIGMPIGSLVWNQTSHDNLCDGWLLDGQQRMTAILGYVSGKLPYPVGAIPICPK